MLRATRFRNQIQGLEHVYMCSTTLTYLLIPYRFFNCQNYSISDEKVIQGSIGPGKKEKISQLEANIVASIV